MQYDLIIIWTWSAWYSAWIYASRFWMKNLIIWSMYWWALSTSHRVENYPWIISESWLEIMNRFKEHSLSCWSEIIISTVVDIKKLEEWFIVILSDWKEYRTKFVLLATWTKHKHLWCIWEKEFLWKWVSYCATCDGMFFRNKDIVIVWWWNTALSESLYLSQIVNRVYLVHRKDYFSAENIWLEQAKQRPNIEFVLNDEVKEIRWNNLVWDVLLKSGNILKVNWIFVAIWFNPNNDLAKKLNLELDNNWYIKVNEKQQTNIKWIYAAWDITTWSDYFKQTIMAASEWCLASKSIYDEVLKKQI